MPSRTRPYRKKARGCFQCSKRRIDCDRDAPCCSKCISKGLQCSGLGTRYRFNDGMAARGPRAGQAVQDVFGELTEDTVVCDDVHHGTLATLQEPFHGGNLPIVYQPSPTALDPWAVHLLSYFSTEIACSLQAIDGRHNGYRHLLLPMAHASPLVLTPVLATAAFHLSRSTAAESRSLSWCPSHLYGKAIAELQKQQNLESADISTRLQILLSILTLLVSVMITGSDDFPVLFRLLESALNAMGGEDELGQDELATFIIRQIHKMRVYAAPLLSEEDGIAILSSTFHTTHAFDCLRFCSKEQPELAAAVPIIESLVQQAYGIYLSQAGLTSTSRYDDSVDRVQRFKDTLERFPPEAPGEQVLIWATFIAASGSLLEEHRMFFGKFLRKLHSLNGFGNILRGIEQLDVIWERRRSPGDRWISMLPMARTFVM